MFSTAIKQWTIDVRRLAGDVVSPAGLGGEKRNCGVAGYLLDHLALEDHDTADRGVFINFDDSIRPVRIECF